MPATVRLLVATRARLLAGAEAAAREEPADFDSFEPRGFLAGREGILISILAGF
jgi:hypothetical protein